MKTLKGESNHFVCPDCRDPLVKSEDESANICEKCDVKFNFNDGIHDLFPQMPFAKVNSVNFAELYQFFGDYPKPENVDILRRNATISMVDGGRILEIGCATGHMTEYLAPKGQVYAADISMSYLKQVRNKVSGITLVRLDAHKLPFNTHFFDNILMTDVLEHVLVPCRVLEEVHRVLKPEGKFILGVPNILNFSNIFKHLRTYKPKGLLQYADAHISFYDPAGLLQLLSANGFVINKYRPIYPFSIARNIIPPAIIRLLDHLFSHLARYFSREMLVIAKKKKKQYWETLKSTILQKKTLLCQNKHE